MSMLRKIAYGGVSVIVGLIVIGACAQAMAPTGGKPSSAPVDFLPTNDAAKDVVVTGCGQANQFGMSTVSVRITNSTKRVQSYMVTASVNDKAGNRLGEANGASNALAPGQSATAELMGSVAAGAANCTVAQVTRIPQ